MAFDKDNFAKISSGYAHIVSPQMFSYLSPTDNIAAMLLPGYFDEINKETDLVEVGDLFLLKPPDTNAALATVVLLNPIVLGPVIESSGFETVEILSFPTVGGSTTENFSFPGVSAIQALAGNEFVIVNMLQAPASPTPDARIRDGEILGDNNVRVRFEIDPSNIHIIMIAHMRRSDFS